MEGIEELERHTYKKFSLVYSLFKHNDVCNLQLWNILIERTVLLDIMTIIVVLYFQKILAAKTPQTSRLFGQLLKLTKIKLQFIGLIA